MGLEQDPTYLAYMRALGFKEAQSKADADLATQKAQFQVDTQKPELEYQGGIDRRNVENSWEDRGLFRSTGALQAVADQQHAMDYKIAQLEANASMDIGDIQRRMADQVSQGNRDLADQSLLADSRQYLQQGLAPYRLPYAAQAGIV